MTELRSGSLAWAGRSPNRRCSSGWVRSCRGGGPRRPPARSRHSARRQIVVINSAPRRR
jgi:hypothetical protein